MSRPRPALVTVDVGDTLGRSTGERYIATLARLSGYPETYVQQVTDRYLLTAASRDAQILVRLADKLGVPPDTILRDCLTEPFVVFAEAPAAVAGLAEQARVVTLSNSHPWHWHHHQAVWNSCGQHLTAMHTSYHLGIAKPDPDVFRTVARHHNVEVHNLLHIGDSWGDDVLGATAAGGRAMWLSRGRTPPEAYESDTVLITPSIATAPADFGRWLDNDANTPRQHPR